MWWAAPGAPNENPPIRYWPWGGASVAAVNEPTPAFEYEVRLLPRGRWTFRRWRWELWHGAVLRAAGWRTSPRAAERALSGSAAYWAHVALGIAPPEPQRAQPLDRFGLGATVRVECGEVACVLQPRGWGEPA